MLCCDDVDNDGLWIKEKGLLLLVCPVLLLYTYQEGNGMALEYLNNSLDLFIVVWLFICPFDAKEAAEGDIKKELRNNKRGTLHFMSLRPTDRSMSKFYE